MILKTGKFKKIYKVITAQEPLQREAFCNTGY
jgi:hypothetical protein